LFGRGELFEVCFGLMHIPYGERVPSINYSTNVEALRAMGKRIHHSKKCNKCVSPKGHGEGEFPFNKANVLALKVMPIVG
jgi:hypothetical protein